jgi:hypothetical protein
MAQERKSKAKGKGKAKPAENSAVNGDEESDEDAIAA